MMDLECEWPIAARTCATEERRRGLMLPILRKAADHYGLPEGAEHDMMEQFDHDVDAIAVEDMNAEIALYSSLRKERMSKVG